ncbi:hypothetical protein [Streptomyces prasinopilosus]|uniref:Transposase n=1 Tax=Streptomyces prasinopilosus TaxID=67344 RepID=A0A1G6XV07_9ACTN|nr:hypothetical protein SAMN05216505_11260 [Streptomyces prasinopilosus]
MDALTRDFVSAHRADFGVQRICRARGTSRAGHHRYLATRQARVERSAEEERTAIAAGPHLPRRT